MEQRSARMPAVLLSVGAYPEHPTVRDMPFFEFRFIIGDVDIDAAFETIRNAGKPDRIGQAQGVA